MGIHPAQRSLAIGAVMTRGCLKSSVVRFAMSVLLAGVLAPGTATPAVGASSGPPGDALAQVTESAPVAASLRVTTSRLPGAVRSSAYRGRVAVAGGRAPYRWSLVSGSLPRGLRLSSTGVVSGVPLSSGARRLTVRVRDANGRTAARSIVMAVVPRGGMLLDSRWIGPVRLGTSPEATLKGLSAQLGPPTSTGSASCEPIGPSHGFWAAWGDFSVIGIARAGEPIRIDSWSLRGANLPALIRPRDGMGVGTKLARLLARYPRADVDAESLFAAPDLLVTLGESAWWVSHTRRVVTATSYRTPWCE